MLLVNVERTILINLHSLLIVAPITTGILGLILLQMCRTLGYSDKEDTIPAHLLSSRRRDLSENLKKIPMLNLEMRNHLVKYSHFADKIQTVNEKSNPVR